LTEREVREAVLRHGRRPTDPQIVSVRRALRKLEAAGRVFCFEFFASHGEGRIWFVEEPLRRSEAASLADRFAKLLGLLSRYHPGERDAAVRQVEQLRKQNRLGWADIIRPTIRVRGGDAEIPSVSDAFPLFPRPGASGSG
jgi:hypothetical protein